MEAAENAKQIIGVSFQTSVPFESICSETFTMSREEENVLVRANQMDKDVERGERRYSA